VDEKLELKIKANYLAHKLHKLSEILSEEYCIEKKLMLEIIKKILTKLPEYMK